MHIQGIPTLVHIHKMKLGVADKTPVKGSY